MDNISSSSSDGSGEDDTLEGDATVFKFQNQASIIYKGLEKLYKDKQFTDVTLASGDRKFYCHKAVLATSCPYFMTMFNSSFKESFNADVNMSIDGNTLKAILDFIYSGSIHLDVENVQNILSAANFLQLNILRDGCAKFMEKHITEGNCLETYFYAKAHECSSLAHQSLMLTCKHFTEISRKEKFLNLPFDKVIDVICRDELNIDNEKIAYEACLSWINQDLQDRKQYTVELMQAVRFANLEVYYFCDNVANNELLQQHNQIRTVIKQVEYYNLVKERKHEVDLNSVPRSGMSNEQGVLIVANPYHTMYPDRDGVGDGVDWLNVKTGKITQVTSLSNPLFLPGVCVTGDGHICIAGGAINRGKRFAKGDLKVSKKVQIIYNNARSKHLNLIQCNEELQVERAMFNLCLLDGNILAIGGHTNNGITASVESFVIDDSSIKSVIRRPLPRALRGSAATSFKGSLYVFGGEDGDQVFKSIYKYDLGRDTWREVCSLKCARSLAACVVYGNKIWITGGCSTVTNKWKTEHMATNCLSSVEIYDPITNKITFGPELPFDICGHGIVKYAETLWIIGGEQGNGLVAGIYKLKPQQDDSFCWDEGPELKLPVSTFGYLVASLSKNYSFWSKESHTKGNYIVKPFCSMY